MNLAAKTRSFSSATDDTPASWDEIRQLCTGLAHSRFVEEFQPNAVGEDFGRSHISGLGSTAMPGVISGPIWKIERYRAKRPILVRIRLEDGIYFAENETLNVLGYGNTQDEAITEFCMHLIHLHQHYINTQDSRLSLGAQDLKARYQDLFQEE